MAHRLIPLTPPLFFHFTLPLIFLQSFFSLCVRRWVIMSGSRKRRGLSSYSCSMHKSLFYQITPRNAPMGQRGGKLVPIAFSL
jgi:hypothetical protein